MRVRLTAKLVEHVVCEGGKRLQMWDATLPGFGLRVTPSGRKTWNVMCREGKRQRRVTLGKYPLISLAEARERAGLILRAVADGKVPEAVMPAPQPEGPTVAEAVAQFIERYAKPRNRCWHQQQKHLNKELCKPHGKQSLVSLKRKDLTTILDEMVARGAPIHANRVLCDIRKFLNWCVERGLLESSPALGLKPPSKEISRDRILDDDELREIWNAAAIDCWPFGTIIQLLILTGQRRGEVTSMRWEEINLEKGIWTIPAVRSKNGRAHEVPLSDLALSLIRKVPRIDDEQMLFSTNGRNPVSGISKAKGRIADVVAAKDWRIHDIRRTVASGMARLGVSPHVIEKVLNHLTGQISGVAAVYNRHGYAAEKTEALKLWGDYVILHCRNEAGAEVSPSASIAA